MPKKLPRPGDLVDCVGFEGERDGPYTVSWCEGTVTFVKAAGGAVIALPTHRLRRSSTGRRAAPPGWRPAATPRR